MKLIGIALHKTLFEELGVELVKMGHQLHNANDKAELENLLSQSQNAYIVADMESKKLDYNVLDVAKHFHDTYPEHTYRWIVISSNMEENFIREVINLGVIGFIPKHLLIGEMVKKIFELLERQLTTKEKRKHVRVMPRKTDKLFYTIPVPNADDYIHGEIENISMGGMMIKGKPENKNFHQFVRPGNVLSNVQITLNQRRLICDVGVIMIHDDLCGLKFLEMADGTSNAIAHYIYERMLESL